MNSIDQLAWAVTECVFSDGPVALADGGSLSLEPVATVLTCREHAAKVARKHGLPTPDSLVPVQVLPNGTRRNHWTHMQGGKHERNCGRPVEIIEGEP